VTNWSREFIGGSVVYVIHADAGDAIGAANTVFQLLPTLQTGEEIRIRPMISGQAQQPFVWEGDQL
jgi:hypothetical protein